MATFSRIILAIKVSATPLPNIINNFNIPIDAVAAVFPVIAAPLDTNFRN